MCNPDAQIPCPRCKSNNVNFRGCFCYCKKCRAVTKVNKFGEVESDNWKRNNRKK